MHESADDLARLQATLDTSFGEAGSHLAHIFSKRMSALELAKWLVGIFEMHLAVVTLDGTPLVAPIDASFYKGAVWFGLAAGSMRAPLVRRDPRVSASYTQESRAFIVHGTAVLVERHSDVGQQFEEFNKGLYVEMYGDGWLKWLESRQDSSPPDEGFMGWIEPRKLFAKK